MNINILLILLLVNIVMVSLIASFFIYHILVTDRDIKQIVHNENILGNLTYNQGKIMHDLETGK
jgi:hypothetical protein